MIDLLASGPDAASSGAAPSEAASPDASCCQTPGCCTPGLDRRRFLQLGGAGAALAFFGAAPVVAGPFGRRAPGDHFVPADKQLDPAWVRALFERGERAWYGGADLATVGMPVGGVAAGQVYLTGDGRLVYWDIFNRNVHTGYGEANYRAGRPPTEVMTREHNDRQAAVEAPTVAQGAALRVRAGGQTLVRALDGRGFPGVRFAGEYPIGYVVYADDAVPVEVRLEAFSPFIPLNADDSALPATVLHYTVRNRSAAPVEATLAAWLQNVAGLYSGARYAGTGRLNRVGRGEGVTSVDGRIESRDPVPGELARERDYGGMSLAVLGAGGTASAALPAGAPPEVLFGPEGLAAARAEATATYDAPLVGAVGRTLTLAPGEEAPVTFVLAWHLPNLYRDDRWVGNYYAKRFEDAAGVVRYVADNLGRLAGETRQWHDTYYDATLPYWLLDRLHMPVANLASTTCQWWRNGRFWAWEGGGCCHGTCGHVWNYAHALARLFPSLERSVREMQDFVDGVGFDPATGAIGFRGEGWTLWAGDAQAGYVLKAYREHQTSPDAAFLERNWPHIRKAMLFLIEQDGNDDGLIEGKQHQTYDMEYYGANTMVGALYLAALRAAEAMAAEVGDDTFAARCRTVFERGRERTLRHLYNGEYFVQAVDLALHPEGQYGDGCLADQLFGQGWAHQLALGYVYPPEAVRSALRAIWAYNWAPDVGPQNAAHAPERWFAHPGEAGLFTCTWPKSPHLGPTSTRYRDEIWTGIEYQVAGHMAWEGMLTEALAIVRGVHERYHPARHNPWNEIECGDHYARALASWGVLTALSGFDYHGPAARIGFAPRLAPEAFRAVFTAAEGWGSLAQQREAGRQTDRLEVRWGRLPVRTLVFELPEGASLREASVTVAGRPVAAEARQEGARVTLALAAAALAEAGEAVEARLTY